MKKHLLHILILLNFSICFSVAGKDIVLLKEDTEAVDPTSATRIYFDDSNLLTIHEITHYNSKFAPSPSPLLNFGLSYKTLWLKFDVKDQSKEKWLLSIPNPIINYLDVYYVTPDTIMQCISGNHMPFNSRDVKNNNFMFFLPRQISEYTVYIKVRSFDPLQVPLKIATIPHFFEETHIMDLANGIYFGFMIIIIFYNLFVFIRTKDTIFIYYVLYTLSFAFLIGQYTGYSFDFIYRNFEYLNPYSHIFYSIASALGIIFCIKFLELKKYLPKLYKFILISSISTYIITAIFNLTGQKLIAGSIVLAGAIIYPSITYVAGIITLRKGFKPAKYYVIAWTFFLLNIIVTVLYSASFIPASYFTINSIQFGSALEVLFLSLALADKINFYKKEKEIAQQKALKLLKEKEQAQQETIRQLKEKEELKDKINKQLEEKVQQRTEELTIKNKELDTFIYKASHDIKGPLKSIIGLTSVGIKELKSPEAKNYFEHILQSTVKLDITLSELILTTKVKEMNVTGTAIDLRNFCYELMSSKEIQEISEKLTILLDIPEELKTFTDERLVEIIFRQLIKNAARFIDPEKNEYLLNIKANPYQQGIILTFSDNGIGMDPALKDKIFTTVFSTNAVSGTGLGLHLVKMCTDKLNGEIYAESHPGKGSKYTLHIPDLLN